MRAIVCGWFSLESRAATAGKLMVGELLCNWLSQAGIPADIALAPPLSGGVDWRRVDPRRYTHIAYISGVCNDVTRGMLERFAHCRRFGINLSMLDEPTDIHPFDLLLERDSTTASRADLSFACTRSEIPVIGLMLSGPQEEYGSRDHHAEVNAQIRAVVSECDVASIAIDTRLHENGAGLSSCAQIESTIAKMDAVITTRLEGFVLSLKNSVPSLVVDPIAGGAKLAMQCNKLGWQHSLIDASLGASSIQEGLQKVLAREAKGEVETCLKRAHALIDIVRREFRRGLDTHPPTAARQTGRR